MNEYSYKKLNIETQTVETAPSPSPSVATQKTETKQPNSVFTGDKTAKTNSSDTTATTQANTQSTAVVKEKKAPEIKAENEETTLVNNPEQKTTSDEPKDEYTKLVEQYSTENNLPNIDKVLETIKSKKTQGKALSETEQKILDMSSENESAKAAPEKSVSAQEDAAAKAAKEKGKEYSSLMMSDGTNYEKTSKILDKYLNENDKTYQNLKTDKEKQKYRDKQIHDMLKFFNPDAKLVEKGPLKGTLGITVEQRAETLAKISSLYAMAGVSGKTVQDYTTKGLKSVNDEISGTVKKQMNAIIQNLDSNNPDKFLNNLAENLLKNDSNYQKLEGKEKEKYKQDKIAQSISKIFDLKISAQDLYSANGESLKKGAVALIKSLQDTGLDIYSFNKSSSKKQAIVLQNVISKNKGAFADLSPEMKTRYELLDIRANITAKLDKENCTELDVYNKLVELKNSGKITKQELLLLDKYDAFKKSGGNLKVKASFDSPTTQAILLGKETAEVIGMKLAMVDKNKILSRDGDINFARLIDSMKTPGEQIGAQDVKKIYTYLEEKLNLSKDQIKDVSKRYGLGDMNANAFLTEAVITNKTDKTKAALNTKAILNTSAEFGTTEDAAKLGKFIETSYAKRCWNVEQQVKLQDGLNEVYAPYNANGMNAYNSREDNVEVVKQLAASQNTTDGYRSTLTSSLVKGATAENQVYYGQELSKIPNSSVTEGLAAAEQYLKGSESDKAKYRSYVDNAIKNNGYSQEEIKNIQTARETGKTSYERAVEQNNTAPDRTSSSSSSSEPKTSAPSQRTSTGTNAKPSSTDTASRSSNRNQNVSSGRTQNQTVIHLSSANQNTINEIRDTIAQLSVKASEEEKQKTLDKITQIIDNIQNDQQVREQKANEETLEEVYSEVDAADVIESAQAKVSDQLKADTSTETQPQQTQVHTQGVSIPVESIEKIKSAAHNGELDVVYNELGKISSHAQQKFIQILAKQDTSTILNFIKNMGSDISLIKEICALDPNIIKSLSSDMLKKLGLEPAKIIEYADSKQLARLMSDLQLGGERDKALLHQFYGSLGSEAETYMTAGEKSKSSEYTTTAMNTPAVPSPGSKEWEEQMRQNMIEASIATSNNNANNVFGSTTVSSSRFFNGQTRQRIRPQDIPDYRDFLA